MTDYNSITFFEKTINEVELEYFSNCSEDEINFSILKSYFYDEIAKLSSQSEDVDSTSLGGKLNFSK